MSNDAHSSGSTDKVHWKQAQIEVSFKLPKERGSSRITKMEKVSLQGSDCQWTRQKVHFIFINMRGHGRSHMETMIATTKTLTVVTGAQMLCYFLQSCRETVGLPRSPCQGSSALSPLLPVVQYSQWWDVSCRGIHPELTVVRGLNMKCPHRWLILCLSTWSPAGGAVLEGCCTFGRWGLTRGGASVGWALRL